MSRKCNALFVTTPRLRTYLRTAGEPGAEAVVFVHGNTATSRFWEDVMLPLPTSVYAVAPDLRGYGRSETLPVDARRGVRDWSDDVHALVGALGIKAVHLVGWSMGGGVAMQYTIDHPEMVKSVVLVSPVSPYGFSGTRGLDGEACQPDFAGSGAGGVNRNFLALMKAGNIEHGADPMLPRNVLNYTFYKPPFRSAMEDDYLADFMLTAVGDDNYPGDFIPSPNWPFYAPGGRGTLNAFSPKYFCVRDFVNVPSRPPVLWVRGADDQLVSDSSLWDIAVLGKMGAVPGWPGESVCPPQPMVGQMRALLNQYATAGGSYREVVFTDCGHSPHIEKTDDFVKALFEHLNL